MEQLIIKINGVNVENIPVLIRKDSIQSVENTILDPNIAKSGGIIILPQTMNGPNGPINQIKVPRLPPFDMGEFILIDDIALKANNVCRVINLYKNKEKTLSALQKSINNYYNTIIDHLAGKTGSLIADVISSRTSNSGRAVLTPSAPDIFNNSFNPEHVYIPINMFRKLRLTDGEPVIVGRDPTIWKWSIEVLRAYPTNSYTISLHPSIFAQFGADCDGDTVWVMKVPDNLKCLTEAHANIARYIKENPQPAMDLSVTGFSVSPRDIVNDGPNCLTFETNTNKKVQDEAKRIINGLTIFEYVDYILAINLTMLVQKTYLGPVGAASQKLKLMVHNQTIADSANYVSERAQQLLFDVKGVVKGKKNEDLQKFFILLDILNLRNKYKNPNLSMNEVLTDVESCGLNKEKAGPILRYIYFGYIALHMTGSLMKDKIISYCIHGNSDIIDDTFQCLNEIRVVSKNTIIDAFNSFKTNLTLTKMLNNSIYNASASSSPTVVTDALMIIKNSIGNQAMNKADMLLNLIRKAGESIV